MDAVAEARRKTLTISAMRSVASMGQPHHKHLEPPHRLCHHLATASGAFGNVGSLTDERICPTRPDQLTYQEIHHGEAQAQ